MAKSFSIDYQKFKNLLSDQIVEDNRERTKI